MKIQHGVAAAVGLMAGIMVAALIRESASGPPLDAARDVRGTSAAVKPTDALGAPAAPRMDVPTERTRADPAPAVDATPIIPAPTPEPVRDEPVRRAASPPRGFAQRARTQRGAHRVPFLVEPAAGATGAGPVAESARTGTSDHAGAKHPPRQPAPTSVAPTPARAAAADAAAAPRADPRPAPASPSRAAASVASGGDAAAGGAAAPNGTRVPDACALRWRPGLVPRIRPPEDANLSAWSHSAGAGRERLDRFFAKLLSGQNVTVYFLGESVTRGTGADHQCVTCSAPPPQPGRHAWINQSAIDAGALGAHYAAAGARGAGASWPCAAEEAERDTYERCASARRRRGAPPPPADAASEARARACEAVERVCFPRNSWRCLVLHWLQHAFPGQVTMRTSAKPLLFMASCFARALDGVDLVVHEYAVNGGGRMLCLQERVLRAALLGPGLPAVLMLLWIPKHFRPAPPRTVLTDVQDALGELGDHYELPTLRMAKAFSAPCPSASAAVLRSSRTGAGAGWCYGRNASRGGEDGLLHGDMYHPNTDGHAFFAAHVLELLERSATNAQRGWAYAASDGAAAARAAPRALSARARRMPTPLHELNRGLDSSAEGGRNLCVGVDEMESLATRNVGWARVQELTASNIRRLPALQTDALGSSIEWTLDVRGVAWLIVTYMQSYAGFGAAEVRCVSGCACAMHAAQASADVDGVAAELPGHAGVNVNVINATSARTRTSEPQWRILDVSEHSAACTVRVTTVSPGKFKLMLLSLVRVAPVDAAAGTPTSQTGGGASQRALQCFGVHDDASTKHGHGMVAVGESVNLDHFTLDDSRYWNRKTAGPGLGRKRRR